MSDDTNDDIGRATSIDLASVLSLLRTWAEDKVLVRCEIHFGSLAASFRARAVAVSNQSLHLMADDRWAELAFPIRDDFTFGYTDMLDSPEHSEESDHLLVVFFPYDGDPDQADKVILWEIKE